MQRAERNAYRFWLQSLPRTPYTAADAASARVLNLTDLRRYTDEPASAFRKESKEIRVSVRAVLSAIFDTPNVLSGIFGSGLFGNARLRELVARYADQDMLAAIAAEHARGRRLFVVTTNLDTQRTVIWDMGRIASIGSSESMRR